MGEVAAEYTEEQFARLPKWAQSLVKSSERARQTARNEIAGIQEVREGLLADAANTVLTPEGEGTGSWRGPVVAVRDPYDSSPIPVARERDSIRFYYDQENKRHWIDVSIRYGAVQIQANGVINIRSHSSNTFSVTTEGM